MTQTPIMNVHGAEEFYVDYFPEQQNKSRPGEYVSSKPIRSNIPAFASTVQKTKQWVVELMQLLQWEDGQKAYHGLRVVLHALRDRLTVKEATDLAAQLPTLIRGMYYECWQPSHVPVRDRTKEDFLTHVFKSFPGDTSVDPERLTHAVLHVLKNHVSEGEIEDIAAILPAPLRDFVQRS